MPQRKRKKGNMQFLNNVQIFKIMVQKDLKIVINMY